MARQAAPGTRDHILDNAGRLFRRHGVRAVGMQQIIDECGCGKNLLYREFPSKDDLVVAYLERCQDQWTEMMDDATRPYEERGDAAGQLVAMVRVAVQQVPPGTSAAARSATPVPSSPTRTIRSTGPRWPTSGSCGRD
jgi:AcrR family transcriptional regulator